MLRREDLIVTNRSRGGGLYRDCREFLGFYMDANHAVMVPSSSSEVAGGGRETRVIWGLNNLGSSGR
jgi:hypothetical protein